MPVYTHGRVKSPAFATGTASFVHVALDCVEDVEFPDTVDAGSDRG